MSHLSEEELLAQLYGESENAVAEEHLAHCAECSRACAALRSDLSEMKFADPPERDRFYGERVWASLRNSLPASAAQKKSFFRTGPWRGFSYAAACVLLGAFTFIGGRLWERKQVQNVAAMPPVESRQPVTQPQRVVVVVLGDHLDRSERLLVELTHADAGNAELVSPLRDEAQSLLVANRICRQNALHADDAALAAALNRLDHLLQELADQPEGLNPATLTRLQHEINSDGLLFQVRVLRSRLPQQHSTTPDQTKGGII